MAEALDQGTRGASDSHRHGVVAAIGHMPGTRTRETTLDPQTGV